MLKRQQDKWFSKVMVEALSLWLRFLATESISLSRMCWQSPPLLNDFLLPFQVSWWPRSQQTATLLLTIPLSRQVAYNVSKSALLTMKDCLAAEWARYGIVGIERGHFSCF